MATKGKGRPTKRATGAASRQRDVEASKPIRKAIYLSALIYVEGDQAPPANFASLTTSALKKRLQEALKGDQEGLSMTLKKIEPRNDIEEGGEKEEKFQF